MVAIIPFFGGTSSATHSLEETRIDYLTQTVRSIEEQFGIVPAIYQSTKDKIELPPTLPASARMDVDPIWLPYVACKNMQLRLQDQYTAQYGADLVYYTEADQVVHIHDEGVFDLCDEDTYVAPWRLDAIGPNGECEVPDSAQLEINGISYAIANGGHRFQKDADQWDVIDFHAQQQAFSGAWLATAEYFLRTPFRKKVVLPVEHASGFDVKSIGTCVKTAWVERFWIDHLSPRDRWQPPAEESATE